MKTFIFKPRLERGFYTRIHRVKRQEILDREHKKEILEAILDRDAVTGSGENQEKERAERD